MDLDDDDDDDGHHLYRHRRVPIDCFPSRKNIFFFSHSKNRESDSSSEYSDPFSSNFSKLFLDI